MSAGSVQKDGPATARPEQRLHRRYPITLDVQYELLSGSPVFGSGRTVNISSGGVFFETKDNLRIRGSIILTLDWPHEAAPDLKLIVQGRIIRRDGTGTAVKLTHYKFRKSKVRPA
jgi:hypothetical protein